MASFNVVIDTSVLERKLTALEREQLPFARSLAANEAAYLTSQTLRKLLPITLDQPTPFTVSGIRYRKGDKRSPAAEIYISDDAAKGTSPAMYLNALIRGQRRFQKRSERVLERAGILESDEGWIPASRTGIKLNRYGNLTGGQLTQILSGIKAFGEEGFSANLTPASRARGVKKGRAEYVVMRGRRFPRGVYQRYGPRRTAKHKYGALPAGRKTLPRGIKPQLLFVELPTYSKQLDFYRIAAEESRRRFVRAWPAALRRALATARR